MRRTTRYLRRMAHWFDRLAQITKYLSVKISATCEQQYCITQQINITALRSFALLQTQSKRGTAFIAEKDYRTYK